MATTQTPSSLGQRSKSLPKFPLLFGVWNPEEGWLIDSSIPKFPLLFGVWNPEEGWLIDSSIPVADGSILWTKKISQAQIFRTEAKALLATKHLRDFSQIIAAVRPIDHAIG